MNKDTFMQQLQAKGFPEPVLTRKEAGAVAAHTHQFEPMALITEGEMSLELPGDAEGFARIDRFLPRDDYLVHLGASGLLAQVRRAGPRRRKCSTSSPAPPLDNNRSERRNVGFEGGVHRPPFSWTTRRGNSWNRDVQDVSRCGAVGGEEKLSGFPRQPCCC